MPRRAAGRPAAYTRTRHLARFLDLVSHAVPARVDEEYVQQRVGLRGGDVRAFLQSLRVLGLVDAWGHPTGRLQQLRARERRTPVLREALRAAYPELVERWRSEGRLARESIEDYFKLEYGLGATSAAPAAKLFLDLWDGQVAGSDSPALTETASKGGEAGSPASEWDSLEDRLASPPRQGPTAGSTGAQSVTELVHRMLDQNWDADQIDRILGRLERLLERVTH